MGLQPLIHKGAYKHGIDAVDILHAYNNPIRVFDQDDEISMIIGPACDATLLEVGYAKGRDGILIIHADKARAKYLNRLTKRR